MTTSTPGHKITAMISFAMSMLAGGGQLLSLVVLNHWLNPESFSQVSTVLGTFSIFFIIVELGLQGEIIRRLTKIGVREVLSVAVTLRLSLSVLAFLSAILFSWMGGLSAELKWAVALFSLSYVPISILYTLEELGYATQDPSFLVLCRLSRLIAIVVFMAAIGVIAFMAPGLPIKFVGFGPFSLFALYPMVTLALVVPTLMRLRRLRHLRPVKLMEVVELAKSTKWLAVSTFFRWAGGYLFTLMVVSTIGETQMAAYNVANIVLTPLTIFTQVLVNSHVAKIYRSPQIDLMPALRQFSGLMTGVILTYTLVGSQKVFIDLIFEKVPFDHYWLMFAPLAMAQIFIAACSFMSVIFIDQGRPKLVSISTAIPFAVILGLAPLVTRFGLIKYATVLPLIGAILAFIFYGRELRKLPSQTERSGHTAR